MQLSKAELVARLVAAEPDKAEFSSEDGCVIPALTRLNASRMPRRESGRTRMPRRESGRPADGCWR